MASGKAPRSMPPRTETTAVIIRLLLVSGGEKGEARLTDSTTPMMSIDPSAWRSMRVQKTAVATYGPRATAEEPDCEVSDIKQEGSATSVGVRARMRRVRPSHGAAGLRARPGPDRRDAPRSRTLGS